MSLSNLTPITQSKYNTGTFKTPPNVSLSDNPDPRAIPILSGWKKLGENLLMFSITNYPFATSAIAISTQDRSIDVRISKSDQPSISTTYWQVNTGSDTSETQWKLNFNIYNEAPIVPPTGVWMFSKGQVFDDETHSR